MTIDQLTGRFAAQEGFRRFTAALQGGGQAAACNLAGSSKALVAAAAVKQTKGIHLFALPDHENAAYFYNDLYHLLDGKGTLFFPASAAQGKAGEGSRKRANSSSDNAAVQRITALTAVAGQSRAVANADACAPAPFIAVVSYPDALNEPSLSIEALQKNTLTLHRGEKVNLTFVCETLFEYGFERVDFVSAPGQYAVRGGIVDVFSYSDNKPYRIDFFGNEVETIRSFDTDTQLSVVHCDRIAIINPLQGEQQQCLFADCLPPDTVYWGIADDRLTAASIRHCGQPDPQSEAIDFACIPQPAFNKNFELLAAHVRNMEEEGYAQVICTEQAAQAERLHNIIASINQEQKELDYVLLELHEGFTDRAAKLCCYTDHQIFARYHKYTLHGEIKKSERLTAQELNALQPGDYVVHIDHGVGVFGGLVKQKEQGRQYEYVKLIYSDGDVLMVSVHSLHRISRYKGRDSAAPVIHKLGSGVWARLKQNAKSRVKDIARDLIALYAQRKESSGFAFSGDTYMQTELEASFIYEDTPDQAKTTEAVKRDMEQPVPMDRLICGDVGFGKTEIAIRAAFKAAADGKQTGVLVPTTILALQHYKTFTRRLKNFPCRVEYLNRFKSAAQIRSILADLAAGKIDVLIGTHKLLGKEVKFKDLGLLIIDEEQKFGVASKEKLRKFRLNVDTLTLTATPIPRTLQFSLMGARDLSVIHTPPPNRQPVQTEVHEFNEEVIKEAVSRELNRGGQVFFIHNRIHNIGNIEALVRRLCPDAKIAVAHGQMEGSDMERRVVSFINGEYDVLVSTNIVENGIDIPNANTVIINDAHHFGLSDLHQLRGRVGRSNVKAYCYLLTANGEYLTREAQQRMHALEQFADLGSGFNIAMQDLDIRGAGNLLGSEQSGFITDIGFETYYKILNEALTELRQEQGEMPHTQAETPAAERGSAFCFVADCVVESDIELLLPDEYVSNAAEKIRLYREMNNLQTEESIAVFERQLTDRFGALPEPVRGLLDVVRLRQVGMRLGIEKIALKGGIMIAAFVGNSDSAYYQSPVFSRLLQNIGIQSSRMRLRENGSRLSLTVQRTASVEEAIRALQLLQA